MLPRCYGRPHRPVSPAPVPLLLLALAAVEQGWACGTNPGSECPSKTGLVATTQARKMLVAMPASLRNLWDWSPPGQALSTSAKTAHTATLTSTAPKKTLTMTTKTKTSEVQVGEGKSDPYNCLSHVATWEESWSSSKKAWCCGHRFDCQRSTTAPPPTPVVILPTYDCEAEHLTGSVNWSYMKKKWCCKHENIGCGRAKSTSATPAGSAIANAMAEALTNATLISEPYDCQVNRSNWTFAKRKWCCTHKKIECNDKHAIAIKVELHSRQFLSIGKNPDTGQWHPWMSCLMPILIGFPSLVGALFLVERAGYFQGARRNMTSVVEVQLQPYAPMGDGLHKSPSSGLVPMRE